MSTYLCAFEDWPFGVTTPDPELPDETVQNPINRGDVAASGTYNDGLVDKFLFLCAADISGEYPGGLLLGGWANDGSVIDSVHDDFYIVRPFGNDDGVASDRLDYHKWQGHGQRQVQTVPVADTLSEYPAENQPIILVMEPWWDDTPGWDGWGWKATITFSDPTRPPNARAIGVYNASWSYLYTTGAFVLTETGRDEDGNPIMQWQTHSPPGKATVEKEDTYYALLLGSTQEGRFVLGKEPQTNYFWEGDQVVPGEPWAASGATVTGMAGTVTLVSNVTPFSTGTLVRIEGVEMTVTSVWAGQGLVLDPYRVSTTGASIEVWQ